MSNGKWVRSDFEEEGETLFFFHPADGGGGQAWIALGEDGTAEFRGDHRVVIQKVGAAKERVSIQNSADLVI